MNVTSVRLARRAVGLVGAVLLVALIGLSLVTNLAPLAGREVFTIIGGSMEPAIPLGSMVVVTRSDPMTIEAGDVVTIRADNGIVVTHRVIQVLDLPEGRVFELKGDANEAPDGSHVPARAIVGVADIHVPFAGYARRFLSTPTGLVAAFAALGALGLLYQLLKLIDRPTKTTPRQAPSRSDHDRPPLGFESRDRGSDPRVPGLAAIAIVSNIGPRRGSTRPASRPHRSISPRDPITGPCRLPT